MQYSLLKEITQDDIDFVYNLKIDFEINSPYRMGENDSGWCDVAKGAYVLTQFDRFILKNPTPPQVTLLLLKYNDSLVSIPAIINQFLDQAD